LAYLINQKQRSAEISFHLRQSFGIWLTWLTFYILGFLVVMMYTIGSLLLLILWIIGVYYAFSQKQKELPIIGSFYQKQLGFIN